MRPTSIGQHLNSLTFQNGYELLDLYDCTKCAYKRRKEIEGWTLEGEESVRTWEKEDGLRKGGRQQGLTGILVGQFLVQHFVTQAHALELRGNCCRHLSFCSHPFPLLRDGKRQTKRWGGWEGDEGKRRKLKTI